MRSDEHMPLTFFFLISGTEVLRKQDTRVIRSDDHCGKVVEGLSILRIFTNRVKFRCRRPPSYEALYTDKVKFRCRRPPSYESLIYMYMLYMILYVYISIYIYI